MKVKKFVGLAVILLVGIIYFGKIISAEETDKLIWGGQLEDAAEYEEIQELISNNALFSYVRECFEYENIPITPEELDDIAFKPYIIYTPNTVDTIDYFNVGTRDKQEYIDILKQCNYAWQFLFKKDDLYVGVDVFKNQPLTQEIRENLTPEEIERAEQEVGKWTIGGAFYSRNNENLREIAEKLIAEKEDIKDYIIANGYYAGFGDVALGFDDKEVKYIIPLYDTSDKTYKLPKGFSNIVPKDKAISLSSGHLIYKYADAAPYGTMIWEYSKKYTEEHGLIMGGIPGLEELEEKLKAEQKQKDEISKVAVVIAIIVGSTFIIYLVKK